MLLVICVIVLVAVVAVGLVVLFARMSANARMKRYMEAARKLIWEDSLMQSLKFGRDAGDVGYLRMVVGLCQKGKSKNEFVFDPASMVTVGRAPDNKICVRDMKVSMYHCRLYLYEGRVYVEDLNSTNGTVLKTGLFSKKNVTGNVRLHDGDVLCVGDHEFVVTIFTVDPARL